MPSSTIICWAGVSLRGASPFFITVTCTATRLLNFIGVGFSLYHLLHSTFQSASACLLSSASSRENTARRPEGPITVQANRGILPPISTDRKEGKAGGTQVAGSAAPL